MNTLINDISYENICGPLTNASLSVVFDEVCVEEGEPEDNSLSGVPSSAWVDSLYKRNDVFREIETYCRLLFEDVKDTNKKAKSLSAFMTIFSYIGVLAKLAFQENQDYAFNDQKDMRSYRTLIDRFYLGYNDTRNQASVINRHCLAEVLYRKLRCGLLHGGTLNNDKMPHDELITIKITHKEPVCELRKMESELLAIQNGSNIKKEFVISAKAMYGLIDIVLDKMFKGENGNGVDEAVKQSILAVYKKEPFVVDLKSLN